MANNYPENLLYTKEHEWCRVDGDVATIGITWHAQSALGDVVFCELPAVGATLTQGATFGVVESVKAVSDLYAPLSGTIVERNEAVVDEPGVLNTDAYEAGWMLKVKLSATDEVKNLLSQKDYLALLESAA